MAEQQLLRKVQNLLEFDVDIKAAAKFRKHSQSVRDLLLLVRLHRRVRMWRICFNEIVSHELNEVSEIDECEVGVKVDLLVEEKDIRDRKKRARPVFILHQSCNCATVQVVNVLDAKHVPHVVYHRHSWETLQQTSPVGYWPVPARLAPAPFGLCWFDMFRV